MVRKGTKLSEETKKRISEAVKRKFKEHPEIITNGVKKWKKFFKTNRGKEILKEANLKRSKALKGIKKKPFTKSHIEKIRSAVKEQHKRSFPWGRRKSSKIHLKFKKELEKFCKGFKSEEFIRLKELNRWISPDELDRNRKIAIFIDGEHWHAKDYPDDFIVRPLNKSAKDIRLKDKEDTDCLVNKGYKVLRFWVKDLEDNLDSCIQKVLEITD